MIQESGEGKKKSGGKSAISDFFPSKGENKCKTVTELPQESVLLSTSASPIITTVEEETMRQSPASPLILSDSSDGKEPLRQFKINPSSCITSEVVFCEKISSDNILSDSNDSSSSPSPISVQDDDLFITVRPKSKRAIQSQSDNEVISIEDSEVDAPSQKLSQSESSSDSVSTVDSSSDSDSLDLNQTCTSILPLSCSLPFGCYQIPRSPGIHLEESFRSIARGTDSSTIWDI